MNMLLSQLKGPQIMISPLEFNTACTISDLMAQGPTLSNLRHVLAIAVGFLKKNGLQSNRLQMNRNTPLTDNVIPFNPCDR